MTDEFRENDTDSLDISKPISYASLTEKEFDSLMNQAAKSYSNGLCTAIADFGMEISKEFGI